MPPKKNRQFKAAKRKEKRKQISPLFDHTCGQDKNSYSGQCKSGQCKTGSASVSPPENNESKRQRGLQTDYFLYDTQSVSNMNNMSNMNFSQPFPGQFVQSLQQSPPGQFQFSQQPQQSQTPQWAMSIIKDVQIIKEKVDKIDSIERTVNSINLRLSDLDLKVKDIDSRVSEVEQNASFLSGKYEEQYKDLKRTKDGIKDLESNRKSLEKTMDSMQRGQAELRSKSLDNEFRSMRENLIFYGIPETPMQAPKPLNSNTDQQQNGAPSVPMEQGSGTNSVTESCETLVKDFITSKLEIDASHMIIDRAHRLGNKYRAKLPRPIIIKFHYFQERERVREASFAKREDLKKTNSGVSIQIPKEWRDARQRLSSAFKQEKDKGNKVKFIGENLYVNNEIYTPKYNSA